MLGNQLFQALLSHRCYCMGLKLFRLLQADVFVTEMIVADFQHDGTMARDREMLKI